MVELNQLMYYHRRYREFSMVGLVPAMTCDVCNTYYYPRSFDYDNLVLWCYFCDYTMEPGEAINRKVVKEVKRIEGVKW